MQKIQLEANILVLSYETAHKKLDFQITKKVRNSTGNGKHFLNFCFDKDLSFFHLIHATIRLLGRRYLIDV